MVRKCRDAALLEMARKVGLGASACQTLVAAKEKKRKFKCSKEFNFPVAHHSRKRVKDTPSGDSSATVDEFCSSGDHVLTTEGRICTSDHESASCCSSDGSTSCQPDERNIKFADLEGEEEVSIEDKAAMYASCIERRETMASSNDIEDEEIQQLSSNLNSPARFSSLSGENSCRRSLTVAKMPTEVELEEFFLEAEKKLLAQFAAKYNYDIVKNKPLEGRYEWVGLSP